ncbi:MAG: universal stress protein [Chloroflexi bacterium]|nr:universal stress protein [Chloroflexota bacterium]MBP8058258.1 universal stress protein [Chloroflexota bacterium]
MYKKILVPLDGSPLAEAVLPHAQALAQSEGAELVLLRVAVDPGAEFAFADPALAAGIIQEMEEETKAYMAGIAARMKEAGYLASTMMREGPIAETILAVAEETQADVIAMSTHGRSGLSRWLMGSIADRVVKHSHVPVMVIRPQNGK